MTNPKHTSSDLVEWCSQDLPCARYQALEAERADRIEALEAALSWSLIQLGSETGYNMESPIWHAYDRARDVLNRVRK